MRVFDAAATRTALPFGPLIEALATMFARGCETPPRHVHALDGGSLLIMPAWRAGAFLGVKTVTVFPANAARGLGAIQASYTLHDAATGAALALMDGNEITARRTAAASALAARHLARPRARRLLVVGAGSVASLMPAAMRAALPDLDEVVVWARRPGVAAELAARCGGRAEADLEVAVRSADIVSCATLASAPLVRGDWLRPGSHLDLVGSFTPAMREADGRAFARARVFVDTAEALVKSGDLLGAVAEGCFEPGALQGDLAQLCRGERAGRRDDDEITLFKSVGTALEDLAAAEMIWASTG